MRVIFAGTPEAAVPSLRAVLASRHDVAAVLTRPDRPRGRGRRTTPSPVAELAAKAGIETLKPTTPRDLAFLQRLGEIAPDCCPIVAYGGLIPRQALAVPPHGWVNLHFSVLPAWRGAAPVQRALMAGDEVTGATTFRLVEELDAGPTYGLLTEQVQADDTAQSLLDRLAEHGAALLLATLDGIEDGGLEARPQPADGVSFAPKLTVDDARIRWELPASAVDRHIRACTPAPGAWTSTGGERLKVWPVKIVDVPEALEPGVVQVTKQAVFVGTGSAPVQLGDVQPSGKSTMPAADWARGVRSAISVLGA